IACLVVTDRDVGALREHDVERWRRSAGANDPHAMTARELDGRDADGASGAMNQHRLARLALTALKERAIRRGVRNTERRALRERHALAQRKHTRGGTGDDLRIGAE